MANDGTVTITFKAKGEKELEAALKGLSNAQRGLVNSTAKVAQAENKNIAALRKLSIAAQKQGTTLAKLAGSNKLLKNAASGSAVAMRKLEARVKGYSKASLLGVRNTRILGGSIAVLRSKLLVFSFAVGGTIAILNKFASVARKSAALKTMETGFLNLGKSINFTKASIDLLSDAVDGTVQRFDLLKQANNALLLGVVKNDKEMANLFDTAQRLAKAVGQDAVFGIESLVTGLGRQSRLMLDNLGIIVDTEKVYKDFAESINITVDAMTDEQKKRSFIIAGLEQAKIKAEALGEEQDDLANTMDRLKKSSTEVAESLGKLLAPIIGGTAIVFTSLSEAIKTFLILFETQEEEVVNVQTEFVRLNSELNILNDRYSVNSWMLTLITDKESDFAKQLKIDNEILNERIKALDKTTDSFARLALMSNIDVKLFDLRDFDTLKILLENIEKIDTINFDIDFTPVLKGIDAFSFGLSQANDLVSALGNNVQANMRNDIAALKKTDAYRNASSERRKTMEEDVVSSHAKAQQRIARLEKASALAQAVINTHRAYTRALPNVPLAVLVAALGGAQIAAIASTPIPQFAEGGSVGGRRHSQGGTMIEAEQGEFILSRDAVASIGLETVNRLNQGQQVSSGITVNGDIYGFDDFRDKVLQANKVNGMGLA